MVEKLKQFVLSYFIIGIWTKRSPLSIEKKNRIISAVTRCTGKVITEYASYSNSCKFSYVAACETSLT